MAPTVELLIAARLLQGVAGSMLIPQNSGLVQELIRGAERGRAFGIIGTTAGIAIATGSEVGGLILTAFRGRKREASSSALWRHHDQTIHM